MLSVFTDNHQKITPNEIVLKSANAENLEQYFWRNDDYTTDFEGFYLKASWQKPDKHQIGKHG